MAEIIEMELWKETIKHAFSLNQNISSNLLSTKGTFARLIHYNQGMAFLENGVSKNDPIVKSMFEDPPTGYPDEINHWKDAIDISDAQYFENLNYITQNSIPMLNQVDINEKAKLSLAKATLNIVNEEQLIKERNPEIFRKQFFDNLSGEIITQSQSVDYGNRIKGLYRKDIAGYDSKLLWGISEKKQREMEKEALIEIDPEYRLSELTNENESLDLIDELKNTYKDIDGYQKLFLKGNELYQNSKLSIDDKFDILIDEAYVYDAKNKTAFGQIIEDNIHDNGLETIDSVMDLADGQEKLDFNYQKLINQGYEYVNIEKNAPITNGDLENTLNSFRDDQRFSFKGKITSRLNEIYVNNPEVFKTYAKEEKLILINKQYELNGNKLDEKDFGNIIKGLKLEAKYYEGNKNMNFENYDNTTPLFKEQYSREEANNLFEQNPLELAKQIKNYHEKEPNYSYKYNTADLALEEVKDKALEDGVPSEELMYLDIDLVEPPMSDKEIADRKAEAEHEDSLLDAYDEQQEQAYENVEINGISNQINSNLKPLLDKETISKNQFDSGINYLKEQNELSDESVPFDTIYSELLVEEGIRIKGDKYFTEDKSGYRELTEKEYSKLLKDSKWELEAYKSDKKFQKMNPAKSTTYSDKEKLYQESLKELQNPEVKQDFRVAATIIKRESGSFDGIDPFDRFTTDKELANQMANFKMAELLKNPAHNYDLKTDFPDYGIKTYELMRNEINQYLKNRDEEVKKYIPKDELNNYEYKRSQERQNYRIFGTKESRDYNQKIDEMNLKGVNEIEKAFSSNEAFEKHLTKYGHLYSNYGAVNALVISNQIDKSMKENPNLSGDSTNIAIRKEWVDKGMYPKNTDAIGFIFVPNKEGEVANNKAVTDVKIAPFFTSDSFKDYGKDHKDKSKLAAYKIRSTDPNYAIKNDFKEFAYKSSLENVYKYTDIKDPLVKLGVEYSVKKALGITKEPFKLPREFDIKEINNPRDQLSRLNQIHNHAKKIFGLSRSNIWNLKENLTKNNNKSQSKQLGQNKGIKQHTHKR